MSSKINSNELFEKKIQLKKSKFKEVKGVFLEWSLRSNLDCFTKIFEYQNNTLAKLFWLIVLLASSGFTFWSISRIVLEYLNYEIVSKIGMIYENPTKFPTVTICDNNPFTSADAERYFEVISKTIDLKPNDPNFFRVAKMTASIPSDEIKKRLGFNLSDKVTFCLFSGQECKASDFSWYWSFDYGNCFQFNSGFNLTNHKVDLLNGQSGQDFGLQLTLYPLENMNKYPSTADAGLSVFVHNNSWRPLKSESVFAKPGEKTHILVKRTFTHLLSYPFSKCQDLTRYSSKFYDFIKKSNQAYRQTECVGLCLQELSIQMCGCIFSAYPHTNAMTARFCLNKTDWLCFKDLYFNFRPEECIKTWCPLECDSIQYDLTVSSLVSPTIQYYNNLAYRETKVKNLTYESFKSMMVQLNVYYTSLYITEISYSPKISEFELFSQIGGTLSCFVSLSIFTLFEIIEILVLITHAIIFKST